MQNNELNQQDQEIQALLKDYPMPTASDAFFDQALVRATHEGTRRQRNRWLMTGFGSAVAAGLVFWMIGSAWIMAPNLPATEPSAPGIVMTLAEPRTVNLVFASNEVLDGATLSLQLPVGLELAGFSGQREITWQTSLSEGRNLLPLRLVATAAVNGEVLAILTHGDRSQTFRLRVEVS
jgi:hypothetical protein